MPSGKPRICQTPRFGRIAKKLAQQEKEILDGEVRRILDDPGIGELKKGNLAGIRVHKFKLNNQQVLLAYTESEDEILLITMGSHENYYRDLHRYLS